MRIDHGRWACALISLVPLLHGTPEIRRESGTKDVSDGTAWRPFSSDSPWNQRIPATAATDRESTALIGDFASRGPLFINIRDWSVPVYFVDSDHTPKRDVGDSRPGVYGAGFEFPRAIPIPEEAVASPPFTDDSDNHLCIVDKAKQLEWGMWAARKDAAGRWFTGLGAVTDLSGTGVAPPWFASPREFDAHRARASGFPLIAGLILLDEIKAGHIDHALVFAYDHCRGGLFIPPASTAQVVTPAINDRTGIPMGGSIQLDPAFDVEHSGLSKSGKIIARALQQYGAYCGDFAGANVIYAENSPAAVRQWEGVLRPDELTAVFTSEFIRAHFRVIAMGNLMPGQNLSVPPPYLLTFSVAHESQPATIDQLTRRVSLAVRGKQRARATWSVFPRGTTVKISGRPLDSGTDAIDWSAPQTLVLTAPDGRTTDWQITPAPQPR